MTAECDMTNEEVANLLCEATITSVGIKVYRDTEIPHSIRLVLSTGERVFIDATEDETGRIRLCFSTNADDSLDS